MACSVLFCLLEAVIMRIVWAIDPYAKNAEIQKNAAWAIKSLTRRQPSVIEPVYVVSDSRHHIPPKLTSQYVSQTASDAQDEVDEWMARIRLSQLLPVHVIGPTSSSIHEKARTLVDYAKSEGADLIVASTRARTGPARWFFGSFVETLSLICDIPLLIVNPSWDRRSGFENILFPTDFTPRSHEAFLRLLPFAQKMGSQITIFHKLVFDMMIFPEATMDIQGLPQEVQEEEIEACRQTADLWAREAKRSGVTAQPIVSVRGNESTVSAILKQNRKKPGLIAMAGQSNAVEARLLGSVTRQVLRQSDCPVWIIHPKQRSYLRRAA